MDKYTIIILLVYFVLLIAQFIFVNIRIKNVTIALYKLSKSLDVLYSNDEKILELTKLKSFVELVSEEETNVKHELDREKEKNRIKGAKKSI